MEPLRIVVHRGDVDEATHVVGKRAQLLGFGDDEDVVRVVVGLGELQSVDGRRNIRQPSTVRKVSGSGAPQHT